MKKLDEMMNKMYIKAFCAMEDFKNNEDGDTNFISLMVILGLVGGIAIAFIGFKDQIVNKVTELINNFLNALH